MQQKSAITYTREQLESKVAKCYFDRLPSTSELDHMSASMPVEEFNQLFDMLHAAFEMGIRPEQKQCWHLAGYDESPRWENGDSQWMN